MGGLLNQADWSLPACLRAWVCLHRPQLAGCFRCSRYDNRKSAHMTGQHHALHRISRSCVECSHGRAPEQRVRQIMHHGGSTAPAMLSTVTGAQSTIAAWVKLKFSHSGPLSSAAPMTCKRKVCHRCLPYSVLVCDLVSTAQPPYCQGDWQHTNLFAQLPKATNNIKS